MNGSSDRKLLLSSVCQPFGEKHGDGFGSSYEGTHQIMWAQGEFRTRATTTQWGIDFIAHNLEIPTTTLHYPTMDQFISEIRKGYDYIGIAFVVPTYHKMVPMVQAIRRYAPGSKIILGGYGTVMTDEIEGLADHICRGEGVAFMRGLLGEPVDRPITQPVITQRKSVFSLTLPGQLGYVFAGLGCPNGCDFCATSHYFKRKHIRFLPDGRSILRAIQDLREIYPDMTDFWINDEDFLLNEARGRGFLEAIRESSLPPLSLSIFSSVKALSQFTVDELVEMGVNMVWVGFEGKRAGYAKMKGRPYDELFEDMHRHGISVLASMIIGFDYQTPEIIEEEFEELMSMRPSMSQFLIYGPARGTPGYTRMSTQGRLLPWMQKEYAKQDGFYQVFAHPNLSPEETLRIQRNLYRREFARLGPSIYRVIEDNLVGHLNLRGHPSERVRAKAEKYGRFAHQAMPLIAGSRHRLAPPVRERARELMQRIEQTTGPLSWKERLQARMIPAMVRYTAFKDKYGIGQQPQFSRRAYRMPALEWLRQPSLTTIEKTS